MKPTEWVIVFPLNGDNECKHSLISYNWFKVPGSQKLQDNINKGQRGEMTLIERIKYLPTIVGFIYVTDLQFISSFRLTESYFYFRWSRNAYSVRYAR